MCEEEILSDLHQQQESLSQLKCVRSSTNQRQVQQTNQPIRINYNWPMTATHPSQSGLGWCWVEASCVCVFWMESATLLECCYHLWWRRCTPARLASVLLAVVRCPDEELSWWSFFQFFLKVAVYSVTGIVAARLVTKYGTRPICIAGEIELF